MPSFISIADVNLDFNFGILAWRTTEKAGTDRVKKSMSENEVKAAVR